MIVTQQKKGGTYMIKVSELAKMLSVTRQTIYNKVKDGSIKSIKIGKAIRIPEEEVDRILKEGI